MLERIDGVVLAVPDAAPVTAAWAGLLDAQPDAVERLAVLAATRHRLRLGDGWVDVLEPDGVGPVAAAVSKRGGGHLWAGQCSVPDIDAFCAHLQARGVAWEPVGDQLLLDPASTGGHGLRVLLGAHEQRTQEGAVEHFYEVTNLVADAAAQTPQYAQLFGLDPGSFQPISSEHYGYEGTLTLFHADRLDRFEVITPTAEGTTMHRFFERAGESLYMAFAECGRLAQIEERALAEQVGHTTVPPAAKRGGEEAHTLFVHPAALGGMMLGLSRPGWAWTWSGHPERAERRT